MCLALKPDINRGGLTLCILSADWPQMTSHHIFVQWNLSN